MKDDTLYILEKIWKVELTSFKFDKDKFDYARVRPCNVNYRTYKNFVLGKRIKTKCIVHEGCVASWYSNNSFSTIGSTGPFEQFIVETNINKQVFPLIENWVFEHDWKSYTVCTIDLKTGEKLFDKVDWWLNEKGRWKLI